MSEAEMGALVAAARRTAGLTQAEVATKMLAAGHARWSASVLSYIESGKRRLLATEYAALCDILPMPEFGSRLVGPALGELVALRRLKDRLKEAIRDA